jgi:asparagine synthase (glutamine-hydrolysing)
MFAFSIWDEQKKCLFLSVDPIGIKPLYYYHHNGTFAFASELKSLIKIPDVSRELDIDSLNQYFALGYIPSEGSIFRDIKKLAPGHLLIYSDGNIKKKEFCDLPFFDSYVSKSEEGLVDQLENLLKASISYALRSDVPIGIFLSGGLDSSLVATIAASSASHPVQTFSIGFKDSRYNELPYARRIAHFISSFHHEFYVTIDSLDAIDKISRQYDEPFADSSAIPTYYVSKMASNHVKVCLSGDGGDELFGGYNWYMWVKNAQRIRRLFGGLSKVASYLSSGIPEGIPGKSFLTTIGKDPLSQFIDRIFIFGSAERADLLCREIARDINIQLPEKNISRAFFSSGKDITMKMQSVDLKYYLPFDGLVKVDRASMLSSVEVRPPFLDQDIVKFAFSLPEKYRINRFKKKYLLKKLALKLLPPDFPLERKQGFCVPLREWFSGPLNNIMEEVLHEENVGIYLNSRYIRDLMSVHMTGKSDNSSRLWSVLMFSTWAKNYL